MEILFLARPSRNQSCLGITPEGEKRDPRKEGRHGGLPLRSRSRFFAGAAPVATLLQCSVFVIRIVMSISRNARHSRTHVNARGGNCIRNVGFELYAKLTLRAP
uniref:Uncharacterized protein n=1 Tax=Candidatus Kentrum sp. DK TaxID=2126562 RepID=A0A450SZY7_9GAMM|nr:MAG: hypothetical protein BECKDK2373C_GA0170839_107324 [Candidatus Kentron sp. DK]